MGWYEWCLATIGLVLFLAILGQRDDSELMREDREKRKAKAKAKREQEEEWEEIAAGHITR